MSAVFEPALSGVEDGSIAEDETGLLQRGRGALQGF